MYRKWVHFCEAKKVGLKLTLGRKPWIIKDDTLISVYKSKRKKPKHYLTGLTSEEQFKLYGYWTNKKFLDNMYCEINLEKTRYGYKAKFRCLISKRKKVPRLYFYNIRIC